MMILSKAPLSRRRPPRREHETSQHDPSNLSATLRDLSQQAHRLVRAIDGSATEDSPGMDRNLDSDSRRELARVHAEIVQLQRDLRAQDLHVLASYVASLRDNVEKYLA
jgi:hypothetical protein